jgi:hypothetical protein
MKPIRNSANTTAITMANAKNRSRRWGVEQRQHGVRLVFVLGHHGSLR